MYIKQNRSKNNKTDPKINHQQAADAIVLKSMQMVHITDPRVAGRLLETMVTTRDHREIMREGWSS